MGRIADLFDKWNVLTFKEVVEKEKLQDKFRDALFRKKINQNKHTPQNTMTTYAKRNTK